MAAQLPLFERAPMLQRLEVAVATPPTAPPVPLPLRPMLTKTAIYGRGWDAAAVRRFLGAPDQVRHKGFAELHEYRATRVVTVEAQAEFITWKATRAERRERGQRAATAAAANLAARIGAWTPFIRCLPLDELRRAAIDHYNRRQDDRAMRRAERGYGDDDDGGWRPATPDSAPAFLERIAVNYVRHQLTRYDLQLERITGRAGQERARALLRERVYTAIAEVYPELAAEAERQRKARAGT